MTDGIFDSGLQPERTLLAWRRTCMAFGLACVVAVRFTAEASGILAVLVGLIGVGLATAAYFCAALGYRRANRDLHEAGRLTHGAWAMALATAAALALGASCAAFLVHRLLSI